MQDLKGKTAFITGAASGIGFSLARACGRQGMKVMLADIDQSALDPALELLAVEDIEAAAVPCDVSSDEQIAAVFEHLAKSWDKLDIIVHSVGFAPKEELAGIFSKAL